MAACSSDIFPNLHASGADEETTDGEYSVPWDQQSSTILTKLTSYLSEPAGTSSGLLQTPRSPHEDAANISPLTPNFDRNGDRMKVPPPVPAKPGAAKSYRSMGNLTACNKSEKRHYIASPVMDYSRAEEPILYVKNFVELEDESRIYDDVPNERGDIVVSNGDVSSSQKRAPTCGVRARALLQGNYVKSSEALPSSRQKTTPDSHNRAETKKFVNSSQVSQCRSPVWKFREPTEDARPVIEYDVPWDKKSVNKIPAQGYRFVNGDHRTSEHSASSVQDCEFLGFCQNAYPKPRYGKVWQSPAPPSGIPNKMSTSMTAKAGSTEGLHRVRVNEVHNNTLSPRNKHAKTTTESKLDRKERRKKVVGGGSSHMVETAFCSRKAGPFVELPNECGKASVQRQKQMQDVCFGSFESPKKPAAFSAPNSSRSEELRIKRDKAHDQEANVERLIPENDLGHLPKTSLNQSDSSLYHQRSSKQDTCLKLISRSDLPVNPRYSYADCTGISKVLNDSQVSSQLERRCKTPDSFPSFDSAMEYQRRAHHVNFTTKDLFSKFNHQDVRSPIRHIDSSVSESGLSHTLANDSAGSKEGLRPTSAGGVLTETGRMRSSGSTDSGGDTFDNQKLLDHYDIPWEFCNRSKMDRLKAKANSTSNVVGNKSFEKPGGKGGSELNRQKLSLNFGCAGLNPVAQKINPVLPIEKQIWYHGSISRAEAEARMRRTKEGSYLVRTSEGSKEDYALSVK